MFDDTLYQAYSTVAAQLFVSFPIMDSPLSFPSVQYEEPVFTMSMLLFLPLNASFRLINWVYVPLMSCLTIPCLSTVVEGCV